MFCRQCGYELCGGESGCPSCGANLNIFKSFEPAEAVPFLKNQIFPERYLVIVYDRLGHSIYHLEGYSFKDAMMRVVRQGSWLSMNTNCLVDIADISGYFVDGKTKREFKKRLKILDDPKDSTVFTYCQEAMNEIISTVWDSFINACNLNFIFFRIGGDDSILEDITKHVMKNRYQGKVKLF